MAATRARSWRSRMKFCPSDLLALSPWRAITSRSGSGGVGTHDRIVDGHLQRRGHRPRIGPVLSGDVESRTMVGRGADDRQPERYVDRILEVERLDRDQSLVVVHAQRRVVIGP